jgi:hypothetical protein
MTVAVRKAGIGAGSSFGRIEAVEVKTLGLKTHFALGNHAPRDGNRCAAPFRPVKPKVCLRQNGRRVCATPRNGAFEYPLPV